MPVIAGTLLELVGNALKAAPEQMGDTCENVGVTLVPTVIVIFVGAAHCPAVGVKVYVRVPAAAVDMVFGFHAPTIPLVEVVGNRAGVAPTQ